MTLMTIPTTITIPRRGTDIGGSLGRRRQQQGACATARSLWRIGPVLSLAGCGPVRALSFHATTSRQHPPASSGGVFGIRVMWYHRAMRPAQEAFSVRIGAQGAA